MAEISLGALKKVLDSTGIPFVYRAWPKKAAPPPPFGAYLYRKSNPFAADGKVYFKSHSIHVELYTAQKEPATEKKVEDALDEAGIFWKKSETFIDTEQVFKILYEIGV